MKPLKKPKQVFQAPKGMPDILPKDQIWWGKIWEVGKEVQFFCMTFLLLKLRFWNQLAF